MELDLLNNCQRLPQKKKKLSTPKAAACKKAYLGKTSDQMHLDEGVDSLLCTLGTFLRQFPYEHLLA